MLINRRESVGVGICWYQHLFKSFFYLKREEWVAMSMGEVPTKGNRVDGWKGIADYLDRDVTTVIRWAKFHGLPVNRRPAGSPRRAVFALKSEIDAWVAGHTSSSFPVTENGHRATVEPQSSASVPNLPGAQSGLAAANTLASTGPQTGTHSRGWLKPALFSAAGVAVALLAWAGWRYTKARVLSHAPRLAELQPFEDGPVIFRGSFECVACVPDNSYLASGIADQLASDLIRIPGVHVRALDAVPIPSAREPVKLLLTAKVARMEGSKIAVTIFLASSDTHEELWSRRYETLATGLPALEFEVANDIFRYLKPYLPTRDVTPFKAVWTRDPVAYDLYLRGRDHLVYPGRKNTPAAIQEFREAVRRDPDFGAAYGGLAHAYYFATFDARMPMREAMPLVRANALRAIELDEFAPEGHAILAFEEVTFEYKWQSAEREFQRAIALDPDNPLPHNWYVWLLMGERRWGDAVREAEISESLDPNGLRGQFALAMAELAKGGATRNPDDLATAVTTCRSAIQRHPDGIRARDVLVYALWISHQYKAAAEENLAMAEAMQDVTAISFKRSAKSILAAKGPAQFALAQAHFCEPRAGADYTCELEDTASWYALGGDADNAFRLLNQSVSTRDSSAIEMLYDPALISLTSDPRFQRLKAEIHPGSD
jgi:TolB-like protein